MGFESILFLVLTPPPYPNFIIRSFYEIMFQIDPPPTFNTDFIKYTIFFLKSSLSVALASTFVSSCFVNFEENRDNWFCSFKDVRGELYKFCCVSILTAHMTSCLAGVFSGHSILTKHFFKSWIFFKLNRQKTKLCYWMSLILG